ncbi:MAG: homocysteine S-methyltransferase family protein, partial [Oscillospiraceae bacterium]
MDTPRRKLLDGAMATNMFNLGMPKNICIEEFLLDNSSLIKGLQKQFVESGSDIIYAPTFSANFARLKRFDKQYMVYDYNKRLLALSKEICGEKLVAGNLSPTGLIGNVNEDCTFEEIFDIYKQQANALKQADLFAIETMYSLKEAKAAVLA